MSYSYINASSYSYRLSGKTTKVAMAQIQTSVLAVGPYANPPAGQGLFFLLL